MAIRPAIAGEAASVAALVRAAYAPWVPRIGREPLPMRDDYAARIAAGQCWVLDDGAIRGVVVLEDQPDALLLDNIAAVAPGAGIGRVLMAFTEAEARRRGYRTVRLYTNALMTENIAIYRHLGFVETARQREQGLDRVYMEKALP